MRPSKDSRRNAIARESAPSRRSSCQYGEGVIAAYIGFGTSIMICGCNVRRIRRKRNTLGLAIPGGDASALRLHVRFSRGILSVGDDIVAAGAIRRRRRDEDCPLCHAKAAVLMTMRNPARRIAAHSPALRGRASLSPRCRCSLEMSRQPNPISCSLPSKARPTTGQPRASMPTKDRLSGAPTIGWTGAMDGRARALIRCNMCPEVPR
jgi:hypothetical protein